MNENSWATFKEEFLQESQEEDIAQQRYRKGYLNLARMVNGIHKKGARGSGACSLEEYRTFKALLAILGGDRR